MLPVLPRTTARTTVYENARACNTTLCCVCALVAASFATVFNDTQRNALVTFRHVILYSYCEIYLFLHSYFTMKIISDIDFLDLNSFYDIEKNLFQFCSFSRVILDYSKRFFIKNFLNVRI